MVSILRLYMDASYALAVMAFVGIVSGFATAVITGNTERGVQVALAMFAVTGALLTVRLWRLTRRGGQAANSIAPGASD